MSAPAHPAAQKAPSGRALKRWLLLALKVSLTGGCLAWAFSGMDFESSVFRRPGDLDLRWIAAGLGTAGLAVILGALRLHIHLVAQGLSPGVRRMVGITLVGDLFNLASLGAIGGDAAKIVLVARDRPGRKMGVAVAVMVDHLSGMFGLALLFFLFTAGRIDELAALAPLGRGALVFSYVFICGAVALTLVSFVVTSPLVHGRFHQKLGLDRWEFTRTLPEAYDVYRVKWRHALLGVVVSGLLTLVFFTTFYCAARAVGSDVGLVRVLSAMPVVDVVSSLPVSVAGIGVREKLFSDLLPGLPAGEAVAAAMVGFLCHVAWACVGGVIFLRMRGGLGQGELGGAEVAGELAVSPRAAVPTVDTNENQ